MRSRVDPVTVAEPSPYVSIAEVAQVLGLTVVELRRVLEAAYPPRRGIAEVRVVTGTMVRRSAHVADFSTKF